MDRWPYTYNRLPHAAQPEFQQYSSSAAGTSAQAQLLLQHQLRQAAHQAQAAQAAQQAQQAQQSQHQYLPPSLVAAANNKHHSLGNSSSQTSSATTSSSWKSSSSSNSNGLVIIPEPQKASHRSTNELLGMHFHYFSSKITIKWG